MRGGKREGAGRKGTGATKTIRIPIELEPKILELIARYKANIVSKPEEKPLFENVTKSNTPIKPTCPVLNKDQLHRFRQWLVDTNTAKSPTQARKMTETPKLCRETFIGIRERPIGHNTDAINDLCELY